MRIGRQKIAIPDKYLAIGSMIGEVLCSQKLRPFTVQFTAQTATHQ